MNSSHIEGYATPTPVGMVLLVTPDAEGEIVHEVQPYQASITIAETYNVMVDTILALNGLQADWLLQIGQKLVINPAKVTPSPTLRPLSASPQPATAITITLSRSANTSPGLRICTLSMWPN